ncbi:MAG: hypothetical protein AAF900_00245 [Bacteroidota bacterium]
MSTLHKNQQLLTQTINGYFQQHLSVNETGVLITITDLYATPRLDLVKVYVSFIGPTGLNDSDFLSKIMQTHHWKIKKYLASQLRYVLRRIPAEVRFYLRTHHSHDIPKHKAAITHPRSHS